MRVLLLSPALSADQVVEAAIVKLYVENACRALYGGAVVVGSWEIPAVAMASSTELRGSDALGVQTVMLSVAAAASLCAELESSSFLVLCLNGPVPHPGFSAFAAVASSANRPVVYWKDDVRKLWGLEDDPLTSGLLPGISSRLLLEGPRASLTRFSRLTVDGANAFETLILAAAARTQGAPTALPGAYVRSLVELGKALAGAKDYASVRRTVVAHAELLDASDRAYLGL
jgi:hypothetical protein